MSLFPELLIFCIIIPLFLVGFAAFDASRRGEAQKKSDWPIFANRNNLTFKFKRIFTTIHAGGRYHNRPVQLKSFRTGGGRYEHLSIELSIVNRANISMFIRNYGFRDSFANIYPDHFKKVGRVFGQRYVVEGYPKVFVTHLFDVIDVELTLIKGDDQTLWHKLEVEGKQIRYEQTYTSNLTQVQDLLDLLSRLADEIENFNSQER